MQSQTKSISLFVASLAVATVFAYTIPTTFAQFTSQTSSQNNELAAGTLGVEIVDVNGVASSEPIISVVNAQPGMASQNSVIRIANTGTLATDIRLYTKNLVSSANSLNDVLNIELKNTQNQTIYNGEISSLDVNLLGVTAGSTETLTATVSWPDLVAVDDNPYQGATLSFELSVDSASVSA